MNYTLFGYNNPSGAFCYELISGSSVEIWGRRKPRSLDAEFVYCDLTLDQGNKIHDLKGVLISFAPIWLLSKFLFRISLEQPDRLQKLTGIVAVSSSSYLTKRFAFSNYDKSLAASLTDAQKSLIDLSTSLGINCQIVAPTLVYGMKDEFKDQNVTRMIKLMRLLPVILLPQSTGLRQPIHASQLARVVQTIAENMNRGIWESRHPILLPIGGDEILSYTEMLSRLRESLPIHDAARRCYLVKIPNRIFLALCSLLLPVNTRLFEAVLRINSNLSGFTTANSLLAEEPQSFPILPFFS